MVCLKFVVGLSVCEYVALLKVMDEFLGNKKQSIRLWE